MNMSVSKKIYEYESITKIIFKCLILTLNIKFNNIFKKLIKLLSNVKFIKLMYQLFSKLVFNNNHTK